MLSRTGAAVVAEAVGTFLFFFVGIGAVVAGADLVGVAFAHGLALAVLVSALGAVSGGHFNPAVTVAVRLTGDIGWGGAVGHIVGQRAPAGARGGPPARWHRLGARGGIHRGAAGGRSVSGIRRQGRVPGGIVRRDRR